jgi:hypothetical protein
MNDVGIFYMVLLLKASQPYFHQAMCAKPLIC